MCSSASQGDHIPNMEAGNGVPVVHSDLTNQEVKEALMALAQAVTTQINFRIVPRVNVVKSTTTSSLRGFVRMNPPIFLGSKVGEDPQEFVDGVYKVLSAMGVTFREKAEFLHAN